MLDQEFPATHVIHGTGTLFWAGGMRLGYQNCSHLPHNFLCPFNDDIRLTETALRELIEAHDYLHKNTGHRRNIIAGSFYSQITGRQTYGGYRRRQGLHPLRIEIVPPTPFLQSIDTFNMNLALIPSDVLLDLGFLAPYFRHSGADIEYGMRATRNHVGCWLAPGYSGVCERNDAASESRCQRVTHAFGTKGAPFPQTTRYFREYGGFFWPIWLLQSTCHTLWKAVCPPKSLTEDTGCSRDSEARHVDSHDQPRHGTN